MAKQGFTWEKVRNGCYVLARDSDDKEIGSVHREHQASNYALWIAQDNNLHLNAPKITVDTLEAGKRWLEGRAQEKEPFDPTGL